MNLFSLEGKNAVVVGGAGGIGQTIAQGLAEAGANVAIASRREEALIRAAAEIKEACGKVVTYYTVDASNEESVKALADKANADMGGVQILVNSQGLNKKHNAEDFEMPDFMQMLEVNVYGVMCCCKHFGQYMMKAGYGKIVNVSSVRGKIATVTAGNAGYCATKGAVDMLTRQLASEFGPHGVCVNAIGPTLTITPMMTDLVEQKGGQAWLDKLGEKSPMRRVGKPEDCVGTAVFLAAPASDFMTGSILYPDGGLTAVG